LQRRLPWRNGHIVFEYTNDYFRVESTSVFFEIRPRMVVVKGYSSYREGEWLKKKYVYIYFSGELKPFPERLEQASHTIRDLYEILYTKTFYDEYYTVILPGSFLIDYIIFASNVLLLAMSSKRKVFYEKLNSQLVVYLV